MDQSHAPDALFAEVQRILSLHKSKSRRAEMIVGAITGFLDITGQMQGAGRDRPFDLRAGDDGMRIDVKTQRGGVLHVKKEKVSKQFEAWSTAGGQFLPVQVVIDSRTKGWYVVAGIPTAPRTPLDPLDVQFDPSEPGKPFCIGRCLLEDLSHRERFEEMHKKLNNGVQEVRENGELIQSRAEREYQSYVRQVAGHVLKEKRMQTAVVSSLCSSDEAMNRVAESDEAMARLAHSDEAMSRLAQSEEAMARLAHSDQAMSNLAKSDEAMSRLAQSEEAMSRLAQSEEAMRRLLDPEMFDLWKAKQNKPRT